MTWQALVEYDVIKKIDDVRNELFCGHIYSIFVDQVQFLFGVNDRIFLLNIKLCKTKNIH